MLSSIIKKNLRFIYHPFTQAFYYLRDNYRWSTQVLKIYYGCKHDNNERIFYFGITHHRNIGDLGQYYCIKKWIKENYPQASLYEMEADVIAYNKFRFITKFKKLYKPHDIIIFQSGYTTTDLGGCHDLMHRNIIDYMPDSNILMMPQTIYFKEPLNKERTAASYNRAKHLLFLARDTVSYEMAKNMFPNISVKLFPDIVTTLIGKLTFASKRNGVCICRRTDGEKFYSDKELLNLKHKIEANGSYVDITDTTLNDSFNKISKNLEYYIKKEISLFANYKITITDRYHGTIYSLAAGTPVIILKTTDHKVIGGAEWFRSIYKDYIYVAESIDEAYAIYQEVVNKNLENKLKPYFKEEYYDKLRYIFETSINL